MKYNAVFEAEARRRFGKLSAVLASKVQAAIGELCENPTKLSRQSHFPHPLHFQIFDTYIEHDGERILLKVFFQYSQDESSLLIDDFLIIEIP